MNWIINTLTFQLKNNFVLEELIKQVIHYSTMMICGSADFMRVLRKMFESNYFCEINQCEQDILANCWFDNNLDNYTELNYDFNVMLSRKVIRC